jgi:hypothetical protein
VTTDAGHYELHLKVDWARSAPIQLDLEPDGEAAVRCWPNGHALLALSWITLGRSGFGGRTSVADWG